MTKILKIDPENFTLKELRPAAAALLEGGVVAAATESFYALLVMADHPPALEKLFFLKFGREPGYSWNGGDVTAAGAAAAGENAFLLLLDSRERVKAYAREIPREAERLMDLHWPGLLTLVFQAQGGLHPAILGGGKSSVALRVDRFPVPGALSRMTDRGVTGTSANPHGSPPAVCAGEVLEYFRGRLDMVVDTDKGPKDPPSAADHRPSTILDVSRRPFSVLREGAVNGKEVLKALSFPPKS
ncbi:MAG: L-threonylcarbamoyladenylate synthase [Deltaproteobacteria bacterium]|nr:L-threonylcarbamoyladenylate synthase [Deltaproteobacteria bacterium]